MSRPFSRPFARGRILFWGALLGLVAAGCAKPTAPDPGGAGALAPVAVPEVEVRTLQSDPDPSYEATCQTGAQVVLKASGSFDPKGQSLVEYTWRDQVDGELTADFLPSTNPMRVTEPEVSIGLYTIGVHEITLTVRAADGRKATQTVQVLVTFCEECGP